MTAFQRLYLASLQEFIRDRMTVFWSLAFPVLLLVAFGTIFSLQGDTKFKVGLVVEDRGVAASRLQTDFSAVPAFTWVQGDRQEQLAALRRGAVRAVIVLPTGLSDAVAARRPISIPVYYDPAQQQTSQIVLQLIHQELEQADRAISGAPVLLPADERTIQVDHTTPIDLFVPGVMAMSLLQVGLFGTAQPIVELRQGGVLRRLAVTPLSRWTLLASQVALRLTIAVVQAVVILLLGRLAFGMSVSGNLLAVMGVIALGSLAFIALGYVVAAFSRNGETASGISSVLSFPMWFLSGLFVPIELMPGFVRPVSQILPLTYVTDALRQELVGAPGLYPVAVDSAVLLGWLAVCLVLAVRFFQWE